MIFVSQSPASPGLRSLCNSEFCLSVKMSCYAPNCLFTFNPPILAPLWSPRGRGDEARSLPVHGEGQGGDQKALNRSLRNMSKNVRRACFR